MEARTEAETIVSVRLVPHPAMPRGPVSELIVMIGRRGETLWLRFVAEGDVEDIRWPALEGPGRADDLWTRTCFEVFVDTSDGYREFNLSPSGQWAAYAFTGYRQGGRDATETATVAGLDGDEGLVALEGLIDLPGSATRLGLSAVIEARDGAKTYWALTHPTEAPDFHDPASFTLAVPEPA